MKTKIGYKVCDDQMHSVLAYVNPVEYKLQEFIKPQKRCGPLCVFNDIEFALSFASGTTSRVFECEYIPSKKSKVWDDRRKEDLTWLPLNTVLASAVKLLEEIK